MLSSFPAAAFVSFEYGNWIGYIKDKENIIGRASRS